jgi:hypothetical protein
VKIAFLNLCHCDPDVVARVANKLTVNENFHMYIHVDAKSTIDKFEEKLKDNPRIVFIKERFKIYWGGFHAIRATLQLLKEALESKEEYDYFVILQNLDYPIKSNTYIEQFFERNNGKEFIRGCNIAKTKDWHFSRKYKIYNKRDDDFYLSNPSKIRKALRYASLRLRSIATISFNGVIKEKEETFPLYYGAAQWAITRECARYIIDFASTHNRFNNVMKHIQFPDEEYFHTIVHNSPFKEQCIIYDEPIKRWLVNWRNLHYFEYPKEITVFTEKDFNKIMMQEDLFCRKVKTDQSEKLMDLIDLATTD